MNTIPLSVELINRILNYLARQPFADVAQMITDIQKAANTSMPTATSVEKEPT